MQLTLENVSALFSWSLRMNGLYENTVGHIALDVESKTAEVFPVQLNSNFAVDLEIFFENVQRFKTSLIFWVLNDFCVPTSRAPFLALNESILVI